VALPFCVHSKTTTKLGTLPFAAFANGGLHAERTRQEQGWHLLLPPFTKDVKDGAPGFGGLAEGGLLGVCISAGWSERTRQEQGWHLLLPPFTKDVKDGAPGFGGWAEGGLLAMFLQGQL